MEQQLERIETYAQVLENAMTFRDIIEEADELIKRLSNFQHWYYFEELDTVAAK